MPRNESSFSRADGELAIRRTEVPAGVTVTAHPV